MTYNIRKPGAATGGTTHGI